MITDLEIINFKGLKQLHISNLKRFNVLIGKNDVGKSTVLESIYCFKAGLVKQPQLFSSILRNYDRTHEGRELWYEHQTGISPTIKMQFHGIDWILTLQSNFKFDAVDVKINIKDKGTCSFTTDSLFQGIRNQQNQNILESLEGHLKEGIGNMQYIHELFIKKTSAWEGSIDITTEKDEYDTDVSVIRSENYTGNENRISVIKNGKTVFLDALGEGHKSGLAILNIVRNISNSIILIEEIENHQHPSSLWNIIEKIIFFCNERKNQVIISTHSPEVLLMFEKIPDVSFYHLQKNRETEIACEEIKPSDIKMIRDLGWNLGNLLRFEKIVIVEGTTDLEVFRHVFYKTKDFWPEEVGISIIPAGNNSTKHKELIKSLSYTDKKLFIQIDKDDKTYEQIKQSIFSTFINELQREGYVLQQDNNLDIVLTNKQGLSKKLSKDYLFITGEDEHFPNIQKHATDDYLLRIIEKNPTIIKKITGSEISLPEFKAEKSKDILEKIFGEYGTSKAIEIIENCNKEDIPDSLKKIIEEITDE